MAEPNAQRYKLRFSKSPRGHYVANFKDADKPSFVDVQDMAQPVMARVPRYTKREQVNEVDNDIAPMAQRAKAFRKKTKIVYKRDSAEVYNDRLAWSLKDDANKVAYNGKPQGGDGTGCYVLFINDTSDTFRVIPVRKWVNFARDWDAYKEDPELNQLQQQQQQMAIKAEAKSVGMTVIKNEVKSEAGVVSASDIFSGRLNRVAGASAAKLKRERTDDDGEMGDEDNQDELDFDEIEDDDIADDASETIGNISTRYKVETRLKAEKLSKVGEQLMSAARHVSKIGKTHAVKAASSSAGASSSSTAASSSPTAAKPEPLDEDEFGEPAAKRARTDGQSPNGSPPGSPSGGSPSSPTTGAAAPGTLLTEVEVRAFIRMARPTSEDLMKKFKARFKQNRENKAILQDVIKRLCKMETDPDGSKRFALKNPV